MNMHTLTAPSPWSRIWRGVLTATIAAAATLGCFLVLPLLQAISATEPSDLDVRSADTAALPPPPPPVEEEEKPPEEPEDTPPPELEDAAEPLDLAQLELALNPGMGGDGSGGDFAIKIQALGGSGNGNGGDELFSLADLDQKPRAAYQQQPALTAALRKKTPATVNILFTVDESGRVENPIVQSSSDPAFDAPALAAIKQWKFEPGKRAGKPVRFRMRQPMTFK
jgi:periplasmic protein TonB